MSIFLIIFQVRKMTTTQEPATNGKAIEVEMKFTIPAGLEDNIRTHGGSLLHQKTFKDVYYDTHCSHLYLNDFWMRRRDETWELKCPPRGVHQPVKGSTQYAEFEVESEILHELQHILPRDLDLMKSMNELDLFNDDSKLAQNWASIEEVNDTKWKNLTVGKLVEKYLVEIASFVTERKTYRLDDCLVVLDQADFGYKLGEIEKVVYSQEEVPEARRGIDQLAEKLGTES